MEAYANFITILSLILTIISLIFAFATGSQLKKSLIKLADVEKSSSTRSIGEYPNHLDEIADLLSGAKKSIKIGGTVSYGATFYKHKYERIKSVIIEKSAEIPSIEIVTEHGEKLDSYRKEWIADIEKESVDKGRDFNKYINEKYQSSRIKECRSGGDLHNLVINDNVFSLRNFIDAEKINLSILDDHIPVHFWVVDEMEAIFVIKCFPTRNYYAFKTRDGKIIDTLIDAWNSMSEKSTPIFEQKQI